MKRKRKYEYRARRRINGILKLVSRVVMEESLGRSLGTKEIVHHKDRDITNDNLENLQLVSLERHSSYHFEGRRKLNPPDVRTVRKMLASGVKPCIIAFIYSISQATVSQIKTGERWAWVK